MSLKQAGVVNRLGITAGAVILFCLVSTAFAEPPRLSVRPLGPNQLQLIATSLQTNVTYMVMVRSNSPYAHWVALSWILAGTNSTASEQHDLGGRDQPKELRGLSGANFKDWTFVIGSGEDQDGNGLPDLYDELALRSDPYAGADPYGDPDQDGWVNLQEMQNITNPFRWDEPPPPQGITVNRYTNDTLVLQWLKVGQARVDYFLVQKAQRTLLPDPDRTPIIEPGKPVNEQEVLEYWARMRRQGRLSARSFSRDHVERWVTNSYQLVAKIPALPGQQTYTYTETNAAVTPLSEPLFRIRAHYPPVFEAVLNDVSAKGIRGTVLQVATRPGTNGYELRVKSPIPHGRYLLLVRDKENPRWRASGYFVAETNSNEVEFRADAKGMMREGQVPIAMPTVRILPDVVDPEFTAGWGEDSDGDGLPDIYEVLVTETAPEKADTGDTGVLDGYKEPAGDGWSCLEKFRRRVDPRKPDFPPSPLVLKKPDLVEIWRAMGSQELKTDLPYRPEITIREPGEKVFKPANNDLLSLAYVKAAADPRNARMEVDVRIVWELPRPRPSSN